MFAKVTSIQKNCKVFLFLFVLHYLLYFVTYLAYFHWQQQRHADEMVDRSIYGVLWIRSTISPIILSSELRNRLYPELMWIRTRSLILGRIWLCLLYGKNFEDTAVSILLLDEYSREITAETQSQEMQRSCQAQNQSI
ncbi:hypothetical protein T10_12578 [Trichinella papuae]|uniref:Uncharacterized protein n=1 Tax=Trichinella papuae TaxID=268474 RepID=A0A0V1MIQ3_9BILA|nr:hypothetical protein T10_12578 [Trichinella papuae]